MLLGITQRGKENTPGREKRTTTDDCDKNTSAVPAKPPLKKSKFSRFDSDPAEGTPAVAVIKSEPDLTPPPLREQAGWITQVDIRNFLGHEDRCIKFGRNVNFVTGRNGSGKSSLHSAIAVALGKRTPDRGETLESYIRQGGAKKAVVGVTLSNVGINAHKPEIWGKTIKIERTITKQNGNKLATTAYRIVSEDGRTIRERKKDLDIILRHFKIQIDSPASFLDQRMSKEFFESFTPQSLYKLFFHAYGYAEAVRVNTHEDGVDSAQLARDQKIKDFEALKKEVAEWERIRNGAVSIGDLDEKILAAKAQEVLWKRKKVSDSILDLVEKIKQRRSEEGVLKNEIEEADLLSSTPSDVGLGEADRIRKKLTEQNNLLAAKIQERQILEAELTTFSQGSSRNRSSNMHGTGRAAGNTSRNESVSRNDSIGNSFQEEETVKVLQMRQKELDRDICLLKREVDKLRHFRHDRTTAQERLTRVDDDIRSAENLPSGWDTLFQNSETLQAEIGRLRWKSSIAPIGPIGSFVTATSFKLATAEALHKILSAYVVPCWEDVEPLRAIVKSHGHPDPPVFVLDKSVLDNAHYPKGPDLTHVEGARTLEDVLTIPDPSMKDILCKYFYIGRVVLMNTPQAALTLLNSSCPNVEKIYDSKGASYESSSTDYRITCARPRHGFLQEEDKERFIRKLKEHRAQFSEISELEDRVGQLETAEQNLNDRIRTLSETTTRLHEVMESSRIGSNRGRNSRGKSTPRKSGHFSDMEAATGLSPILLPSGKEGLLKKLQKEENTLRQKVAELKKSLSNLEKKKKEENGIVAKRKRDTDKKRRRVQELEKEIEWLEKEKVGFENRIAATDDELESMNLSIDSEPVHGTMAEAQVELAKLQRNRAALIVDSTKYSKEKCDSKISELNKHMHSAKRHLDKACRLVEDIEKNHKFRKDNMENNVVRGELLVKEKCRLILMESGYDAHLVFDHRKETLQYNIKTDRMASGKFDNVDKFSGGEKAYAVAALLGALWEPETSPFRAMDEIDVFMDYQNRERAFRCLVQLAAEQNVQAIFLSPTDFKLERIRPDNVSPRFFTRIEMEST